MIYGSIIFLILAAVIAAGNIGGCTAAMLSKRKGSDKGYSCIPLFSLLFSVGSWLLGRNTIGWWAFVPAILDPGTWVLIALPGALIELFRNGKNANTEPTSGGDVANRVAPQK
ncbi:MAG: hypothetical protein NTV22_15650 [bacterium]|nr:hypothetical protein [bacterium]